MCPGAPKMLFAVHRSDEERAGVSRHVPSSNDGWSDRTSSRATSRIRIEVDMTAQFSGARARWYLAACWWGTPPESSSKIRSTEWTVLQSS